MECFNCSKIYDFLGGAGLDNPAFENDKNENVKFEGASVNNTLPWKRDDQDVQVHAMTDTVVPAYMKNKDHGHYSSPSNSLHADGSSKKRNAIIGYFQKRDSLTFLGDLDNLDSRSGPRRNSKESTDLLTVLANPVNIRKSSAPPLNRQISLSSMKVTFLKFVDRYLQNTYNFLTL